MLIVRVFPSVNHQFNLIKVLSPSNRKYAINFVILRFFYIVHVILYRCNSRWDHEHEEIKVLGFFRCSVPALTNFENQSYWQIFTLRITLACRRHPIEVYRLDS